MSYTLAEQDNDDIKDGLFACIEAIGLLRDGLAQIAYVLGCATGDIMPDGPVGAEGANDDDDTYRVDEDGGAL